MRKSKLLFFAIILFIGTAVNAQNFGLKAGVNFSRLSSNVTKISNIHTGFNVGPIVEFGLSEKLFINSGIFYTVKGDNMMQDDATLSSGETIDIPQFETTINYIEMPLNFAYKISMSKINLFFQAGPYVACAINGESKIGDTKQDITFGDDNNEANRFDVGIGIGTGIEIRKFVFSLNFDAGFRNFRNAPYEGSTSKTQTGSVSLAYMFGND